MKTTIDIGEIFRKRGWDTSALDAIMGNTSDDEMERLRSENTHLRNMIKELSKLI